jgi:uncharacterized protein YbjQ (UPF0145 family)
MIVTTTENIAGYRATQSLGQVFGVVVRSRGLAGNFVAALRTIIGGEIKEYSALVEDTRRHALDRLVSNARAMGADAVVMMRFDSGQIGQAMNEVVAYGTAVKIEPCNAPGCQHRDALHRAGAGCGGAGFLADVAGGGSAGVMGAIMAISVLVERRYRGRASRPESGWEPTPEKFLDEDTGQVMQVWYHPGTGQRDYRPAQP